MAMKNAESYKQTKRNVLVLAAEALDVPVKFLTNFTSTNGLIIPSKDAKQCLKHINFIIKQNKTENSEEEKKGKEINEKALRSMKRVCHSAVPEFYREKGYYV